MMKIKKFVLTISLLSVFTVFGGMSAGAFNAVKVAPYSMGDLDGDGMITAADARIALLHSTGRHTLNEKHIRIADIDGNGKIEHADARAILRYSSGLISSMNSSGRNTEIK